MLTGLKRGTTPIDDSIIEAVWGLLKNTSHVGFPRSMVGSLSRSVYLTDNLTDKVFQFHNEEWREIYIPVLQTLSFEGGREHWAGKMREDAMGVVGAHLRESHAKYIEARQAPK